MGLIYPVSFWTFDEIMYVASTKNVPFQIDSKATIHTVQIWDSQVPLTANRSVMRAIIFPSNSSNASRKRVSIDSTFSSSSATGSVFASPVNSCVTMSALLMNNISQQWLANLCCTRCAKLSRNFTNSFFFCCTVLSSIKRSIKREQDCEQAILSSFPSASLNTLARK